MRAAEEMAFVARNVEPISSRLVELYRNAYKKARVRLGALSGANRLPNDPSRFGMPRLARSPSTRARPPTARAPNAFGPGSPQFVGAVPGGSTRASYRTLGIVIFNLSLGEVATFLRKALKFKHLEHVPFVAAQQFDADNICVSRCSGEQGRELMSSATDLRRMAVQADGSGAHVGRP